ncbi:MAG: hypothetical protein IJ326_04425 [Lachnospiraceae bacterium]|nr:hypothetical protein [Lachnospiraceae bacterium]
MIVKDLQGIWELCLDEKKQYSVPPKGEDTICLPNSTANAKKGVCKTEPTTDFMTDQYYFEGYAWYTREIKVEESWTDKKLTLFLERTRISTVYIDGVELDTQDSLCGYHKHDLTGKLSAGAHRLTIRVNNTDYPTRGGHMTSPDTQTNWNGIVGRIELQIREQVYPENVQVDAKTVDKVCVSADVAGLSEGEAQVVIRRKSGDVLYEVSHSFDAGKLEVELALAGEDLLWDEYHTNLLEAEVSVAGESEQVCFGIRKLSCDKRRLLVNGKQIFLRGKHDGLVFPSTGFAPMTVEEWKKVFATAMEYGINHYRFHTCCPPDAAFAAADEMGIYMEPELPFWGTIAAPGEEYYNESEQAYLIEEGYRILRDFGNHPSFVMLSMGNELWGNKERINSFLHNYKKVDSRHLYTQGSNNFQWVPEVLEDEDVFCGVRLSKERLFRGSYAMCDAPQGHIQVAPPDACHNYDEIIVPSKLGEGTATDGYIEIQYGTGVKKVKAEGGEQELNPEVPVISHEVGQYDFFPDFSELGRYEGSQQPFYLKVYQERMEKSGTFAQWQDFFKATGALALDCYRREIETALRTRELSGFQLLDLQDFPGQCVALVGVLNAWMESKGLISAADWRQFCNDVVILAELESFVVSAGQRIEMPVKLSVCNWDAFAGSELQYRVYCEDCVNLRESAGKNVLSSKTASMITSGSLNVNKDSERLCEAGVVSFAIPALEKPCKVKIELAIAGTEYKNVYELWAYPEYEVKISETEIVCAGKTVRIVRSYEDALNCRRDGIACIYVPVQTAADIEGTYCTDFWNYPMFRSISESMGRKVPVGTLGLYIRKDELGDFPCEAHSTPQWFNLVMHSHCTVLDGQDDVRLLVQPIDNVERCHKLGMLYYQGDVLVCTSRLWEISDHVEVKAFAKMLSEMVGGNVNTIGKIG